MAIESSTEEHVQIINKKMGKRVVKKSESRSEKHHKATGIGFHRVPKDPVRREKWVEIIRLLLKETDWLPTKRTTICSNHLYYIICIILLNIIFQNNTCLFNSIHTFTIH